MSDCPEQMVVQVEFALNKNYLGQMTWIRVIQGKMTWTSLIQDKLDLNKNYSGQNLNNKKDPEKFLFRSKMTWLNFI